ncbi:hypothetical protein C8R43DRAFT_872504 [Mycena crocata]|nr:hypothetical protein C8R43DRAFT_872504 [Mycena crocata]
MGTCREVYVLIHRTCFNVNSVLAPFFGSTSEVERFRRVQAVSGTLVSGSVALQYLNRLAWPESDLDLYIERHFSRLPADFLLTNGYTYRPRPRQNGNVHAQLEYAAREWPAAYMGRGIADVLDFERGDKKVQLIIAQASPMEIVLAFHSTPVMNILTHELAYALFPRSTFETMEALIIETAGLGQTLGRAKYVARGWQMIADGSLSDKSELAIRQVRHVGDTFTWTLPLAPSFPSLSDHPPLSVINSWQLDCDGATTRTAWNRFTHPDAEHQYVIADPANLAAVNL